MLPVAVARSSSDNNAVRYVLPVSWMTSGFHITGHVARGVGNIGYARVGRQAPSSHKFQLYLPGGASCLTFVIVYNSGKLRTEGEVFCL